MTEVNVLPDVEVLLIDFLLAQPEVTAIVDDRVYSELPKDKEFPLVRVHQFGSLPARSPRWYETATVQIEAYGGPKRTARLLADTCAGVMEARLVGVHDQGVVTGVTFTGFADLPDDVFQPARPRWLFTALPTIHP
jgi:hypothetical protein